MRQTCSLTLLVVAMFGCRASQLPTPGQSPPLARVAIQSAADPCAGRVVDKLPRAISPMPLPPVRVPFTDPAFGTTITRVSDASPTEGENAVIKPIYSTMQSWNADESRLLLWHRGKGHELYDGQTYEFIRSLNLISPSDIEVVMWDPWYPRYLYYPSSYAPVTNQPAEPKIYIHDVETNQSYLWMDLDAMGICRQEWATKLTLGNDPSAVSFLTYEPTVGMRCADRSLIVNLWRKTIMSVTHDSTSAPQASPHGHRFLYQGTPGSMSFNGFFGAQKFLHIELEHGCVGTSWQAMASWNSVGFDLNPSAILIRTDLETGTRKTIMGEVNGWPYPPTTTHFSAISRAIGWVAISSVGDPNQAGKIPLHQEVYLANTDTGAVCRVAHHRSWAREGPWDYWGEPHVSISPSGNRAVFASDWGGGPVVNSFVVDLR